MDEEKMAAYPLKPYRGPYLEKLNMSGLMVKPVD
jgi:hypothetical protein